MSARAIALGLAGAAAVCTVTYYNDHVLRQTSFVGNNMPLSVYGGLIVFLLAVNPLLRRVGWRPLAGGELAVALALTLAACAIPGSGLMRTFTNSLMLPHRYAKTEEGWKSQRIVEHLPARMLADVGENEDAALNGFVQGLGVGGAHISVDQVPWGAWTRTLAFWLPLILLLWFALMGLAVVVHRQWAHHEQLTYPVAVFAHSLLPEEGQARGGVFASRLFWGGLAVVLVIHLNNYAAVWSAKMIQLPLEFDFTSLTDLFPTLRRGGGMWRLLRPHIYPTVVAFSFFLAGDVSFSLGIGPFLFSLVCGILAGYGISMTGGGYLGTNPRAFVTFGAFVGLVVTIAYTGRYYYKAVFRRALRLKAAQDVDPQAVWGARAFMACTALFMVDVMALGLSWPLTLLYTTFVVVMFLAMSRIMAETGLFYMQTYWFPCAIAGGLLGFAAIGPTAMMIMMMLTTVLLIDPRESVMPFVVNALKLVDTWRLRVGTTALWSAAAVILGLALAVPLVLYLQYDLGTDVADTWAATSVPTMAFERGVDIKTRLAAQGQLERSEGLSWYASLASASPDWYMVLAMTLGLGAVLLMAAARMRFARWPVHPVLFLTWSTYPALVFADSFLVGWLVKAAVTKYGGETSYRTLKPLMFGLIAGDMLGGIVPSLIGALYYFVTGEIPQKFQIMPA